MKLVDKNTGSISIKLGVRNVQAGQLECEPGWRGQTFAFLYSGTTNISPLLHSLTYLTMSHNSTIQKFR